MKLELYVFICGDVYFTNKSSRFKKKSDLNLKNFKELSTPIVEEDLLKKALEVDTLPQDEKMKDVKNWTVYIPNKTL